MIASSTDMSTGAPPESSGVIEEAAAPSPTASDSGSSVSTSGGSPSAFAMNMAGAPDDAMLAAGNQFMNWSYKNVELLGERNREMAEQFAELRNEFGGRTKNEEH